MTSLQQLSTLTNKRISLKLNAKRQISGVLSSYDKFMNLTLTNVVEHVKGNTGNNNNNNSSSSQNDTNGLQFTELPGFVIVRGSCIEMIEVLDDRILQERAEEEKRRRQEEEEKSRNATLAPSKEQIEL